MNHDTLIIIPARMDSRRFPGKPLAPLGGCTVIGHVIKAALEVTGHVVVATDSPQIAAEAQARGVQAVLTEGAYTCGTERCADAFRVVGGGSYAVVVNLQADEPMITPEEISAVAQAARSGEIATIVHRVRADSDEAKSADSVKVVTDLAGSAMYFSRALIPTGAEDVLLHVGIYAMTPERLLEVGQLPRSPLAAAESLEQLTWLQHDLPVRCIVTPSKHISIDTPSDLALAQKYFQTDD